MLENINVNVINGILILGGGVLLLFGVGGVAAVIAYLRQHGKELERAYESADPQTKALLLRLVSEGQAALNLANSLIAGLAQFIQLGTEITDGDPTTPADPATMLSQAAKLEAKAKIIRTTALRVAQSTPPPEPPPVPDHPSRVDAYGNG